MKEIWKDIKDYEGLYQVSNLGNVKSLDRYVNYKIKDTKRKLLGKSKKLSLNEKGYLKVTLHKNCKGKTREVQRLVAETFIPNPENKPQVNHIDGNKTNNYVTNLEWVTESENMVHAFNILERGLREVKQYDLKGNYISTYKSVKEAGEKNNIARCGISNVLHGKRNKAGGYLWKTN